MDLQETVAALCKIPAPAGFEGAAVGAAVSLLSDCMDRAYVDHFGNAIGLRLCGREHAPKLLLDAHLDEIGFLVTEVKDGFLRFVRLGGVDPRILPNQRVSILADTPLAGLLVCLPPHLQTAESQGKTLPIDELWIDTGLGQEEAQARIPVGTPVVFDSPFVALQNGKWSSKALDDRAGFAAILLALDFLKNETLAVDLYVMGSTREEIGGVGARCGCFAIAPDACLAVDVTFGKSPDTSKDDSFPLSKGPCIGVGPSMTRRLSDRLRTLADQQELRHQLEIIGGNSGTNAWHMQTCREGLATALLSIPLRYMHTACEVIAARDIEDTARLLAAFVRDFTGEGAPYAGATL